jgi:hypothetical protein
MREFGLEGLLIPLLFAVVVLANLLVRFVKKTSSPPQEAPSPELPPVLEDISWGRRPVETIAAPSPAVIQPRPTTALQAPEVSSSPPEAKVHPGARLARHALLSNRRTLREAIVLMTILGPCRGNEPSGKLITSRMGEG